MEAWNSRQRRLIRRVDAFREYITNLSPVGFQTKHDEYKVSWMLQWNDLISGQPSPECDRGGDGGSKGEEKSGSSVGVCAQFQSCES